MTTAKVLDTISRLHGMVGESNDQFLRAQVNMKDASILLRNAPQFAYGSIVIFIH